MITEDNMDIGELEDRDRTMQREERWRKIRNSRYNKWYGLVKKKRASGYLNKRWTGGR